MWNLKTAKDVLLGTQSLYGMIGMRGNSLTLWLVQEYTDAAIWLVHEYTSAEIWFMQETYSNEQSDSNGQHTTLWGKNLKEGGSWEEISVSSWLHKCNSN